jgi:hypothetical protein
VVLSERIEAQEAAKKIEEQATEKESSLGRRRYWLFGPREKVEKV